MRLVHVQQPGVVRIGDAVARYARDDVSMYGEYHLAIYVYPGNLQRTNRYTIVQHTHTLAVINERVVVTHKSG